MKQKKYIFRFRSDLTHYQTDFFTVRCVDDRFWKAFKNFLRSLGIKRVDPKSPAGGPKVLSSPEKIGDRDYMLREIEKSIRLHGIKKVMLFSHHDCGAYGGFKSFNQNPGKELGFHQKELRKAHQVINRRFPKLRVLTYFIDNEGILKIKF